MFLQDKLYSCHTYCIKSVSNSASRRNSCQTLLKYLCHAVAKTIKTNPIKNKTKHNVDLYVYQCFLFIYPQHI